jgi:serine/threonine protein kinase
MISVETLNTTLADRYLVERELGSGGMATVYLARDVRHERRVALKVLRPELAAVIGAARFAQEIRTTANLQHPHILPLHDSGEIEGTVFYVMPYVEGETLRDRLTRETQLPVDDAIRLIQQVASALDYAHRQGIVHRDIKPENILVQDGQALVADFGIALAASRSDNSTRLTETGMSLGTPSYMSPEQAMGQREIGPAADIYALGCVLYEMLVGEPPFTGPSAQAVVAKVITDRPSSVSRIRGRVPVHVDAAIQTALEKLPADRFPSARAFADALTSLTKATAPHATPVRSSRRTIAVLTAGGAALGALATFAVISLTTPSAPGREWSAELLSGLHPAMNPRVSPDGEHLAYAAHLGRQTQLGILALKSGDRAILTSDTTRGLISEISWSGDNSRIYYARFFEVPRGVFYVSRLGGEEHLLLEDAGTPEPLPDGSILVTRPIPGRRLRVMRFWPETGHLDSLDATVELPGGWAVTMRAFRDGREFVFNGRTSRDSVDALRIMDLATGRTRSIPTRGRIFDFSLTPDSRFVVVNAFIDGMNHVLGYPRAGGPATPWLTLTFGTKIDVGADGSLFIEEGLGEHDRPGEIVKLRGDARSVVMRRPTPSNMMPLALPDGRLLLLVSTTTRSRIMVEGSGAEPTPFVETNQPTTGPLALLGRDRVILTAGANDSASLAVVSIASRRIVARFPGVVPQAVAGSPDGSTVYYSTRDSIFAQPVSGGPAQPVGNGFGVGVDPHGEYLVIARASESGMQLVRHSLSDGAESIIPLAGNLRHAPYPIPPNSVGPDGRIVALVVTPTLWSWPLVVIDPKTGAAEFLPLFDGTAGWTPEGDILGVSFGVGGRIWRFRPLDSAARN